MNCRLIIDGPADGARNMALDEVLLEETSRSEQCVLRFYQWSTPTLSLGYFQRIAERRSHAASRTCPLVRRASGGGAIVHDRELTYSLCVPRSHPLSRDSMQFYRAVHAALADVVKVATGQAISLREQGQVDSDAFLCFQRSASGDVLMAGAKIAGSAQRRRRGAVLQHGSLVLGTSPCAPEIQGIADACGVAVDAVDVQRTLAPRLKGALGVPMHDSEFSPTEHRQAAELEASKYGHDRWNALR